MATSGRPSAPPAPARRNSAASPSSEAALELAGLTKDFAVGRRGVKLRAVDALSLRLARGQVCGLLGPNGSGKSTTIKLILGLLAPTLGRCAIFGISSDRAEARQRVGYLPEAPYFHRFLTGRELVRFHGRMGGLGGARLAVRVREVIHWAGLDLESERRVETYSKGMLQRLGLAQALVHDPELLILDEPTAGLDPAGTVAFLELIRKLKDAGKTILLTSHLLGQVEDVCDRVAILDRGRLILEANVAELADEPDRQVLAVSPLTPEELDELRDWLAARGRLLKSVETPRPRLDRIFLRLTGRINAGKGRDEP